jgi:hypothetical protein
MSELKVYHHELRHNEYEEFYLKYEVDKVISELKEIDSKNRSAYYKDIAMMAKDVERHKYKRCLAMASYWVAVSYQCVDDKHRKSAERHHRKWLELAEKFKDNEVK